MITSSCWSRLRGATGCDFGSDGVALALFVARLDDGIASGLSRCAESTRVAPRRQLIRRRPRPAGCADNSFCKPPQFRLVRERIAAPGSKADRAISESREGFRTRQQKLRVASIVTCPAATVHNGGASRARVMNSSSFRSFLSCAILLCVSTILSPLISRAESIPQTIDNANRWRLRGSVHPSARAEFDRGAVDGSLAMEGMKLVFQFTPEQQISLDTLLRQQLDPSSPNYHRWLTREQYADRFGVSPGDLTRAANWLRQL